MTELEWRGLRAQKLVLTDRIRHNNTQIVSIGASDRTHANR